MFIYKYFTMAAVFPYVGPNSVRPEFCASFRAQKHMQRAGSPRPPRGWIAQSLRIAAILSIWFAAIDRPRAQDFETCKAISNDQLRLSCLKSLLEKTSPVEPPALDPWQLVRTPNPAGGLEAVAIMRTANTLRSDPDFAGLIIRCRDARDVDFSLAVVRPFPPRSKPEVVLNWGATSVTVHAEASPAGTALNLSPETASFARNWQTETELHLTIKDPEVSIRGVVALDGFSSAITKLQASCPH